MNHTNTTLFISKCLTLSQNNKHYQSIKELIKQPNFDWDMVVKLATAHYVLPALYINLKSANLLELLPTDLIDYMIYLTELNRERNRSILKQAEEINSLLIKNHITPIFIKGTGNLLGNLYNDIGERMIGDIDILVPTEQLQKTFTILQTHNYDYVEKSQNHYPHFRHLPRIAHPSHIAAVEVHKEMILEEFASEFNYNKVVKTTCTINGYRILSNENKIALTCISKQINDHARYYVTMPLRAAYDLYLLSKKSDVEIALNQFTKLKSPLIKFSYLCSYLFDIPTLKISFNKDLDRYLKHYLTYLNNPDLRKKKNKQIKLFLGIKIKLLTIIRSSYQPALRRWILRKIFSF